MPKSPVIPNHLGLKLAALYDQPNSSGPRPLVILLHGFTGWKEEKHIATLAHDLNAAGIAALRFDASGSGESEGTWAEHYRLSNYLADVMDVLAYAKASLPIDHDRIAIWGHSMGGFTALATAARHPEDFVAVCGSQPSSGWKILPSDQEAAWRTTGWAYYSNSHFKDIKLPYAFYTDRLQFDGRKEVANLKVPSLFISGTTDNLVPAKNVRSLYEAAPQPKQYLEYNIGHDYKKHPEVLHDINTATVAFFAAHLLNKAQI